MNLKFYLRSLLDIQFRSIDLISTLIDDNTRSKRIIHDQHLEFKSYLAVLEQTFKEEFASQTQIEKLKKRVFDSLYRIESIMDDKTDLLEEHTKKISFCLDTVPSEKIRKKVFDKGYIEKFRGKRDEIFKGYETKYTKFLDTISDTNELSNLSCLDLGCGRGEWLEFLRNKGHDVRGIDLYLDEDCSHLWEYLTVGNITECINDLPSDNYDLISMLHVIEHFGINSICYILENIIRIVKPNFKLILELPNVSNAFVSSTHFYNDPTHRSKLPLEYLEHLLSVYEYDIIYKSFSSFNPNHDSLLNNISKSIDHRYNHMDLFIIAEHK